MDNNNGLIKDVAVYLRKSRGDENKDLDKHRLALTELCQKLGIRFTEYAEIGTSDSIHDRPKFVSLLKDIQQGLYDAVVVMDIDRLGRGDDRDWGYIEQVFRDNEVFIITPDRIYNWDDESDEFQLETKKFLARLEYKQITKRLRRGKTIGAKQGKWTNGKPPYPYVYNRQTRMLEVDPEKYKVYRQIIDMAVKGIPPNEIAWELNKLGIPSPGGTCWHNNSIYRLLRDQTHLGKIVACKQKGSGHKNRKTKPYKKLDESEWIAAEGCHPAVKTQEEHDRIIELFAKRRIIPTAARRGAFLLSGLVYCVKCGYRMGITHNKLGNEHIKPCQHRSPVGEKCHNSGILADRIIKQVFEQLLKIRKEIQEKLDNKEIDDTAVLRAAIDEKNKKIQKDQKALENLLIMREDGEIRKDTFLTRKKIREEHIARLKKEIDEIQERIQRREQASNEKKLKNIDLFLKLWNETDEVEHKNQYLKTIIDKIIYINNNGDLDVTINFL